MKDMQGQKKKGRERDDAWPDTQSILFVKKLHSRFLLDLRPAVLLETKLRTNRDKF